MKISGLQIYFSLVQYEYIHDFEFAFVNDEHEFELGFNF